jgi:putative ABC transport system ATP-binding protein
MNNTQTEKNTENKEIFLECRDLKKNFCIRQTRISVLKGLNLKVNRGEIIVICGKSGAGKSTLIALLAGLEPPTSGSIIFAGKNLNELSNEELANLRRKKIGVIFQSFNLLTSWTALENVDAGLMYRGLPQRERSSKIKAMLDILEIDEVRDHLTVELSVGQQQRVAVARALIAEPELILADDPTGDVDPETGGKIINCLISVVRQKGSTLILVSHNNNFFKIANKAFQLENGLLHTANG